MHIGFVTDEISPDISTALHNGLSWGIHHYELRMLGKHRVPNISTADLSNLLSLKAKFGLNFTAISPGTFKCSLRDTKQIELELNDTLPKTFTLAEQLQIKTVLTFSFFKNSGRDRRVITYLRKAADMAQAQDLILAVENEPGFWCDSGKNTARILSEADRENLKANWDPANAISTGERPFPEGYAGIRNWIANVHIKDTLTTTLDKCVTIDKGKMDWKGQLTALIKDRVTDLVTIETHCEPLLQSSRRNLDLVRGILNSIQNSHGVTESTEI